MNINNETLIYLLSIISFSSILLNLWLKSKNEKSEKELNERDKIIISLQEQKSSLERSLFLEEERSTNLKDSFAKEFENLANRIIDQKTTSLEKQTKISIQEVLSPIKENIRHFNQRIETIYSDENKERFSLKNEIKNFIKTNEKMELETQNLVKALKGDVKAQGVWGEVILERILESSGLRENEEFILQGKGMGLETDGKAQRPDVILTLPDGNHIIIDSKVSLTDYEKFASEESDQKKLVHQKRFTESIKNHVKGLSKKEYFSNEKLNSPDFVILFFPMESALHLALKNNPNLIENAWSQSVVILGPTTLFSTLKTIHSVWRIHKSNTNAEKLAIESGKIYDKMVLFINDLVKVGEQLDKAQDSYQSGLLKLNQGKGNIISRFDKIKKLGARTTKSFETLNH